MANSVYLQFPSLDAFLEHVKNYCNIYEIGVVVRRKVENKKINAEASISIVTYYVRITKNAPSRGLIFVCDKVFWSDVPYDGVEKEIQAKRDETLKEVRAAIEKELGKVGSGSHHVHIFDAEFTPEPDL